MTTELQQAISAIRAGRRGTGRRLLAGVLLPQELSGAALSGCSPVLHPEGSQCILNMVSPVS